jgi:arylsulfatase A-like enzyme
MVPALWFYDLQMGLSDSDYNLIQPLASIDAPDGRLGSVELYDLRRDPLETVNLASDPDYAGVLRDMQDKLRDQRAQQRDPSLETPIEGADHEAMLADYQRKYLAARNVS